jgi:hypothetical protein
MLTSSVVTADADTGPSLVLLALFFLEDNDNLFLVFAMFAITAYR